MVEENGSVVDPLASPGSQSGDSAPAIATSVQSLNRTQTHHLVASTSIVQLTLPSSGTTQVLDYNTKNPVARLTIVRLLNILLLVVVFFIYFACNNKTIMQNAGLRLRFIQQYYLE